MSRKIYGIHSMTVNYAGKNVSFNITGEIDLKETKGGTHDEATGGHVILSIDQTKYLLAITTKKEMMEWMYQNTCCPLIQKNGRWDFDNKLWSYESESSGPNFILRWKRKA